VEIDRLETDLGNEETATRIRGTQDYHPVEFYARERAWREIQSVFESFGYQGIEVPIIEYTELHTKKSGEEIRRHMYHFTDLGDRDVCLRPELTASVVRAYNGEMSTEPLPVRLYYMGPTFRYDKPQEGRYRQFTQAGVECIGGDGLEHDAEVVQVARLGLERIGVKGYRCVIGHLGIITEFLESVPELSEPQKSFFVESFEDISKAASMEAGIAAARERFRELPGAAEVSDEVLETVLSFVADLCRISGRPPGVFDAVRGLVQSHRERGLTTRPVEELEEIVRYLDAYDIDWEQTSIDFGFGRGLAYYTGMIFQLHCPNLGAANQVCGGGRYDGLIEFMGGRGPVKAVGFAYGFERIVLSLQKSLSPRNTAYKGKMEVPFADAMVIGIGTQAQNYAIKVAAKLREFGLRVETGAFRKKAGKLANRANTLEIPYVFFIGGDEATSRAVKYKEMQSGDEHVKTFDQLEEVAAEITAARSQLLKPPGS
jgi:histidyl-tRNA synthetase